jgi:hypothetical protein
MDVFTCRRLSSRVKDVINGSLALREKMFLHPTRAAREAWRLDPEIDGSGKGITSVRPVVGMIPFNGNPADHQRWSDPTPHVIRTPAILNPIISNRTDRIPDLYESRDVCDYFFASDIVHRIDTGGPHSTSMSTSLGESIVLHSSRSFKSFGSQLSGLQCTPRAGKRHHYSRSILDYTHSERTRVCLPNGAEAAKEEEETMELH